MANNNFSGEIHDESFEDVIEEEEDTIDSLECDDCGELYEYDDDFSAGDYVIINLVETWKEQQTADRDLKTKYGKWIMAILIIEFIFMSAILVLIGLGKLSFEEWVINAFIVTTFGQIMGVVYLIVKNLFSDANQIIDIIKEYIK
ncbi:hypothetical protein [Paraclostridium bifermentans]|uniref:hypothetical protein n=1 Tax=Paraclostridium bifermentans TaxID=1490 RepID=UPI0018AA2895|nr:hypothetical protein [Paraclostridium bifermentans]